MRKFIVVRGHAGSGKTTFAKEKMALFNLSSHKGAASYDEHNEKINI